MWTYPQGGETVANLTKHELRMLDRVRSRLSCGALNRLFVLMTFVGERGGIWLAWGFLLLLFPAYRAAGCNLILTMALGFLIGNLFLKRVIARPRPSWIRDTALLITNPHDYSFPSGHALSSAIAAVCLTVCDVRFAPIAIPLALLIAFSRVYLYVHYPSDVLGGILLGVIISTLTCRLLLPHLRQWIPEFLARFTH